MDADVSGGTSQSHVSSGTGRNPNGQSASVPASAAGAMPASLNPRELQDGETAGLSLPGILHFIQYEWGRFQAEKYRWEAERDELRKLKTGTDQSPEKKQETKVEPIVNGEGETEKVNGPVSHDPEPESKPYSGGDSLLVRQIEEQIKRNAGKEGSTEHPIRSVLDQIPFLRSCDDEEDSDEDEDFQGIATDCIDGTQKNKKSRGKIFGEPVPTALDPEEDEEDSEDALSEFDFLGSGEEGEGAGEACISGDGRDMGCTLGFSSDVFILDTVGGGDINLGELADLTVANDFTVDPSQILIKQSVENAVLLGHDDSVWDLAYSSTLKRLASCSADGTVRIWDTQSSTPCTSVLHKGREHGTPTSVAFGSVDSSQAVVSFDSGETVLYDLNTEQSIALLETQTKDDTQLINCVVSHPSQPIAITAHENRTIRFLDNRTGKVIHSMVAHLEAVTCLTTDPKGTYLVSGSHDCSVRLWMLDNRTCVQEITAHRKKHDEAIHQVAFHPLQPLIASAGADSLAKIFV
ncbi:Striatin-4 [Bagarius yarrelli]|uniref:Striatin-4 n=1 Tax=Bagarius yarrelli TaxID=175774 RepID=A0A556V835_BAGYA|nr:Striatin-4 [Bagarius yarrelli]